MPGCPKWYNSIPVIGSSLCLRILYITQLNLNHNRVRPDLIRCLTDRWFRALAAAFSSRHPHCTFEGIWHTPKHIKTKPFLGSSIHSLKWKPVTYWRLGNPFICQVWVFCLHAWHLKWVFDPLGSQWYLLTQNVLPMKETSVYFQIRHVFKFLTRKDVTNPGKDCVDWHEVSSRLIAVPFSDLSPGLYFNSLPIYIYAFAHFRNMEITKSTS